MIKSGKVSVIELPLKRKEIRDSQLQLLEDDIENARILYEKEKFMGSLTHAFDAVERLLDCFLAFKGIKFRDRFGRKAAIREYFGEEILGEFEDLFEARKNGMYERGIVPRESVVNIFERFLPELLEEANKRLPKDDKIGLVIEL